jgi:hypothetical protein
MLYKALKIMIIGYLVLTGILFGAAYLISGLEERNIFPSPPKDWRDK